MRPHRAKNLISALIAPLLAVSALSACAEWTRYDDDFQLPGGGAATLEGFDAARLQHLKLRGLMSAYLGASQDGTCVLLDYDALAGSDEARYTLAQYLNVLATVDPSKLVSSNERQAYWINAYNAGVISGVITSYDGSPSFRVTDGGKFFDEPRYTFGGQQGFTLNQIEQGVLRGDWGHASLPRSGARLDQLKRWHQELWGSDGVDPRFHAAVNCAALSCPNLLSAAPYAYDPATLDQQLDAAMKRWLDSPTKGAGPDGVSRLFDWYESDFTTSHGSVSAFIAAFRSGGLTGVDINRFLPYDWTLNIKGAK